MKMGIENNIQIIIIKTTVGNSSKSGIKKEGYRMSGPNKKWID